LHQPITVQEGTFHC